MAWGAPVSSLGNPLIPYGERRRRGTGVPLCYPQAWQRVAVSVRAVVPRARLEVWIGESAASSLVTTRPGAPGRRRSRWEDCLHPPLPRSLSVGPWTAAAHPQPLPLPSETTRALRLCARCPRMILEDAMPRRKSPSSPPDPSAVALLQTLNPHAAGIDVGATDLWVCVPPGAVSSPHASVPGAPAVLPPNVRRFGTFTADLHAIAAWLRQCQVMTVAMESTGVYWIPLYDLLEAEGFQVLLVDPRQVQRAPNRPKTDVHDCQWIQRLHSLGLLTAAFRPEEPIRDCDRVIEAHLQGMALPEVPPLAPKRRVRRRKDNEVTFDARQRLHHVAGVDLTAIEGIEESTALVVLSEIGTDMSRWPSEKHFGSWLGLAPNPKKSGGRVKSSATRPGVNRAAQALRLAAKNLQRSQSALGAFFRRIAARRGLAKAITATAYKLARIIYAD